MMITVITPSNLNKELLSSIVDGDVEFLNELWDCFKEEYKYSYETLRIAAKSKDISTATLHSHNIKSGSANLGAEKLQDISSNLENAAKKADFDYILTSLPVLQKAYDELAFAFADWIKSLQ